MRLAFFLDTNRKITGLAAERKGKVGLILLRSVTILVSLATVWVVVGSIVYPSWWFEFLFKRVSWLMVALPLAAVAASLAFRMWLPKTTVFLDHFGIYVILCCVIAASADAYGINKTQRLKYVAFFGLRNISDAL